MNIAQAQSAVPQSLEDLQGSFNSYVVWFSRLFWVIVFVYLLIAAITFLQAGGDPAKVEKAKKMLLYSVIAACVALLATGIESLATSILSGPSV